MCKIFGHTMFLISPDAAGGAKCRRCGYATSAVKWPRPERKKIMSKKKKPEFVYDHDEAFKLWNPPVQCGDCYVWYDPRANSVCPICGGDEWVGSR